MNEAIESALKRAWIATSAVLLSSGLLGPIALGAPGDFDPTFGGDSRVGPLANFAGPAWAVRPR